MQETCPGDRRGHWDRGQVRGMRGCAGELAQPLRRVKALGAGRSKGSQSSKQVGRGTGGAVHPSLEARGEPCKHQGCSPAPSLALGSTWAKGRIPTGSSCPSAAHPCPALLIPVPGERERTGKGTGQKDKTPWGQHQPHPHLTGASPSRKRGMMFLAELGGPWAHRGQGALHTPGHTSGITRQGNRRAQGRQVTVPVPGSGIPAIWRRLLPPAAGAGREGDGRLRARPRHFPPCSPQSAEGRGPAQTRTASVREERGLRAADDSGTSTSKLG